MVVRATNQNLAAKSLLGMFHKTKTISRSKKVVLVMCLVNYQVKVLYACVLQGKKVKGINVKVRIGSIQMRECMK